MGRGKEVRRERELEENLSKLKVKEVEGRERWEQVAGEMNMDKGERQFGKR